MAQVFAGASGLAGAWAGQPQWRILDTQFGSGLNFLEIWRSWKDDQRRCGLLHYVAVHESPVPASEIVRSITDRPELAPLAKSLGEQWYGLLPGVHRLVFEQGRVLLTLHVRPVREVLRKEPFTVDSVLMQGHAEHSDGASHTGVDKQGWDLHALKALARHCRRGTTLAAFDVTGQTQRELAQCGFTLTCPPSLATDGCISAVYSPAWEPKARRVAPAVKPARCVVIGSGLAGAASAASLTRRGWQVTVLDAASQAAAGASSLPAGLLAPHQSPDDSMLSRLSRAGVRATLQQSHALLRAGSDWQLTGVLEHRAGVPAADQTLADGAWSRPADAIEKTEALLAPDAPACWHAHAAWITPAALVTAWLANPDIEWRGGIRVDRLARRGDGWDIFGEEGEPLAHAELVVVAAAMGSARLLQGRLSTELQPVRGQVSWCEQARGETLPLFPVNGNGHFISGVPAGGGEAWFCGSTFDRGDTDTNERAVDHLANLERLDTLLPAVAAQLKPRFQAGQVKAWTGVRCASSNRRPLMGELEPGLWVSTAMGSRGLTFAVLCAELLAARLHAEPLPLEIKLAAALDATVAR
jgi:tRNA 5-methylaminomethyl-2-thiouridine biosynthesis bifunctional protein